LFSIALCGLNLTCWAKLSGKGQPGRIAEAVHYPLSPMRTIHNRPRRAHPSERTKTVLGAMWYTRRILQSRKKEKAEVFQATRRRQRAKQGARGRRAQRQWRRQSVLDPPVAQDDELQAKFWQGQRSVSYTPPGGRRRMPARLFATPRASPCVPIITRFNTGAGLWVAKRRKSETGLGPTASQRGQKRVCAPYIRVRCTSWHHPVGLMYYAHFSLPAAKRRVRRMLAPYGMKSVKFYRKHQESDMGLTNRTRILKTKSGAPDRRPFVYARSSIVRLNGRRFFSSIVREIRFFVKARRNKSERITYGQQGPSPASPSKCAE